MGDDAAQKIPALLPCSLLVTALVTAAGASFLLAATPLAMGAQKDAQNASSSSLPFASGSMQVIESLTIYPVKSSELPAPTSYIKLPERTSATFGSPLDARTLSLANVGRYDLTQSLFQGTVLESSLAFAVVPACGPSPSFNTLVCYNLLGGERLDELPIPGALSTTPIFFDGTWIFGTTQGFFIRTEGTSVRTTPSLGGSHTAFWGGAARRSMQILRNRTANSTAKSTASLSAGGAQVPGSGAGPSGGDSGALPKGATPTTEGLAQNAAFLPLGWKWFHTGSAEFIGTPIVSGSLVYALSANQFLHAFDLVTGRLVWTSRLAPEAPLRLSGAALTATPREILVGTDEGAVLAFDPKDGTAIWRYLVNSQSEDKFRAIVASPLVLGRSMVVSNAESATQRVSLDGRTVEWSYPVGSIAQVRADESAVYLAGTDGSVTSLESRAGTLRWKVLASPDSPIASVFVSRKKNVLFVATKKGEVSILDLKRGHTLSRLTQVGDVVGEFFAIPGEVSDVCLGFSHAALRCYAAEASNIRR